MTQEKEPNEMLESCWALIDRVKKEKEAWCAKLRYDVDSRTIGIAKGFVMAVKILEELEPENLHPFVKCPHCKDIFIVKELDKIGGNNDY